MNRRTAWSYARWSTLVSLLACLALGFVSWGGGPRFVPWCVAGWLVPTVTGIAGGAVLAGLHGSAGPGFLIALQVCILSRLALSAGGAWAATVGGGVAVRAFLIGLVVGFLPLQVFEIAWFYRRTHALDRGVSEEGPRGSSGRRDS